MSVRLVFVWSDGPNGLEEQLVHRRTARSLSPGLLGAQFDPLTLPQCERRGVLPRDQGRLRVLDVVVAYAGDPRWPSLYVVPAYQPRWVAPAPAYSFRSAYSSARSVHSRYNAWAGGRQVSRKSRPPTLVRKLESGSVPYRPVAPICM